MAAGTDPVEFDLVLTGDVTVVWASDNGKRVSPVVRFTAPSTATPVFIVKSPVRAAANDPAPKVTASMGDNSGGATDSRTFTLTCQ
ncbi:hypothetical protein ACFXA3_32325 [Streptomyces sp. NPDC059456]|uniref:hypothetical protein n=1 Tax=Streptomyces sp. NPDC059456 TaxID=3346838 RepID=UPI00367991B3